MDKLHIFTKDDIRAWVNYRDGETKVGEEINAIMRLQDLHKFQAKYVILGIPEDYGVLANQGIGGAKTAWKSFLQTFLNLQHNRFLNAHQFILLGQLEIDPPRSQKLEHLRDKVSLIDQILYPIIQQIIAANKIPVVIGGGHNNAYGMIKGAALALKQKVNVLNIDAHADLRAIEGRHSGNGFSYAIEDGYLAKYGIFGLQQNAITSHIEKTIQKNTKIYPVYYEEILTQASTISEMFNSLCQKVTPLCGLELDLDSLENTLSSAMSPSGFRLDEIRKIILQYGHNFKYFHICEGASELEDGRVSALMGKTIAFLVSDLAKSYNSTL